MVVVEGKCLTRLCVFGGLCVVMWRLVHQWSFLLFWLSFDCFWLVLTIGTLLVHCWYSLGRPVTIGTPMVLTVFDDWYNVPIVKNSQKQSKNSKNSKKNDHWCTNRHMSTQNPPNTQSLLHDVKRETEWSTWGEPAEYVRGEMSRSRLRRWERWRRYGNVTLVRKWRRFSIRVMSVSVVCWMWWRWMTIDRARPCRELDALPHYNVLPSSK